MKKISITLGAIALILLSGCAAADKISSGMSSLTSGIPAELQSEVDSRVDNETELFGFGSASSDKTGSAAGQMKALDNAKNQISGKIKKEVQADLNTYIAELDSYTQTLIKPAFTELTNHATDLSLNNVSQKGAWEDDKKVYAMVTVNKSDIAAHSRNVLSSFLDNMSEKISNVKNKL